MIPCSDAGKSGKKPASGTCRDAYERIWCSDAGKTGKKPASCASGGLQEVLERGIYIKKSPQVGLRRLVVMSARNYFVVTLMLSRYHLFWLLAAFWIEGSAFVGRIVRTVSAVAPLSSRVTCCQASSLWSSAVG